jgi:hypothetical protein
VLFQKTLGSIMPKNFFRAIAPLASIFASVYVWFTHFCERSRSLSLRVSSQEEAPMHALGAREEINPDFMAFTGKYLSI